MRAEYLVVWTVVKMVGEKVDKKAQLWAVKMVEWKVDSTVEMKAGVMVATKVALKAVK